MLLLVLAPQNVTPSELDAALQDTPNCSFKNCLSRTLFVLSSGNTPLLTAANEGHLDIARVLLEAGSEPLTVNNSGSTGLHLAAYQRNVPLIKVPTAVKLGAREAVVAGSQRGLK